MNNFEGHINGDKPVVVDFFAEWCAPCRMMPPVLKEVKEKLGDSVTVLKMDIDKNPHYTNQYGVQAVPTLIVFKNGKIIWRKAGVASANEIIQHVKLLV
ncbi:MAG: thioredoxin [Sphingobacteriales bacterium]|nr:thioredoxin [Sphingobacteriales bacterium]MBI3717138.1 thioredoxin [Sphingobacteriales bacterium]